MKSYKDLLIWQRSIDLSVQVYAVSEKFPDDEKFGLTSQVRRAITSVPLNIAEGWGRELNKSFIHFLRIARASLYEVDTALTIAQKLKYIEKQVAEAIYLEIGEIAKMINAFINKINENEKS